MDLPSTTYTTIPISGADVISRSFQNLSTFLSARRSWPEFISISNTFDIPPSLSDACVRLRINSKYFFVNYSIYISICAAASLLGDPIGLVFFALVSLLWLILYFFREDPMVVFGYNVSDWLVKAGLVIVTVLTLMYIQILTNLIIGTGVGLCVSAIHGVLRNPEGLLLDENDAVSTGLIRSSTLY